MIYSSLKFLHVVFAIVALGTNITFGFWLRWARRDPDKYAFVLKGVKFLDDYVANPCYAGLGISGPLMVWMGGLGFGTKWVWMALSLFTLMVILGAGVYTPLLSRQIALLEERGPEDLEFKAAAKKSAIFGPFLGLMVLAIVYLMVMKPT